MTAPLILTFSLERRLIQFLLAFEPESRYDVGHLFGHHLRRRKKFFSRKTGALASRPNVGLEILKETNHVLHQ